MSLGTSLRSWLNRTGSDILGWTLVIVGIPLMPLPGPGTIVIVSGLAILSRHYVWAQRIRDPLERRAIEAARFGVRTWPRIFVSFLGGAWLFALGVIWFLQPQIPEFEVLDIGFGPDLPAAGLVTAIGLWTSAVAAWALLAYSVIRWREPSADPVDPVVGPPSPA